MLKSIICAALVNMDKMLLGTEEGLYAYEITKEKHIRIDDVKKVLQVEVIPEEQLIIVLSGNLHYYIFTSVSYVFVTFNNV